MKNIFRFFAAVIIVILTCDSAYAAKSDHYSELEKKKSSEMTTDQFLDLVQYKSFLFFWNEANPETGLIKDRAKNFETDKASVASTAAVGFGLTAVCVAEKRGWVSRKEAKARVLNTLLSYRDKVYNNHGFFYHFVDMDSGERYWKSELSSIDTALFLAGAMTAGEYFGGEIKKVADEIYERVDWRWMMADGSTLNMGWDPETGFLNTWWAVYCEDLILYILAIGSPTHPISASVWNNIGRPVGNYSGNTVIESAPLFTHQYSHIWVDFRGVHDNYADYFENSVYATLANRAYCVDELSKQFKTYNENVWGLTAGDGPDGYKAYGGKPGRAERPDGTVFPTAAGSSIVFTPELSISALKYMYDNYRDKIWGKYGFADSFNLDRNWTASDVIGIDAGPLVLMLENYRSGMIWKYFMKNKPVKKAMEKVGFVPGKKAPSSLTMLNLEGKWRFNKGDDPSWKLLCYDDSKWAGIDAAKDWHEAGYPDYYGFAWYRKSFEIEKNKKKIWDKQEIIFQAGSIDDVDAVYLNGKKIGGLGQFPPLFKTAYDKIRIYRVPGSLINYGGKNVIAVRVYDEKGEGGIVSGPVSIGPLASIQFKPVVYKPAETEPLVIAFNSDRKDYRSNEAVSIPVWVINNTDEEVKDAQVGLQLKDETVDKIYLKNKVKVDLKSEEYLDVSNVQYKFPGDVKNGVLYGLEAQLKDSKDVMLARDTTYFKVVKVEPPKPPESPKIEVVVKPSYGSDVFELKGDIIFLSKDARSTAGFIIPSVFAKRWEGKNIGLFFDGMKIEDREIYLNGVKITLAAKGIYNIPKSRKVFWFINKPVINFGKENVLSIPETGSIPRIKIGPVEKLR